MERGQLHKWAAFEQIPLRLGTRQHSSGTKGYLATCMMLGATPHGGEHRDAARGRFNADGNQSRDMVVEKAEPFKGRVLPIARKPELAGRPGSVARNRIRVLSSGCAPHQAAHRRCRTWRRYEKTSGRFRGLLDAVSAFTAGRQLGQNLVLRATVRNSK